jgi:hypothetical protein
VATSKQIINSPNQNDTVSVQTPIKDPIPAVVVEPKRVKQAPKPVPTPIAAEKPIVPAENNSISNITHTAKPKPDKKPAKKKPDISLSIMDQVLVKDTVKFGQSILITLQASGIKAKDMAVYNTLGKQLKPMAVDGRTFYFELPYSTTLFNLRVYDLGAKISKEREFKGNANCKWYVKRVLGSNTGVKVD